MADITPHPVEVKIRSAAQAVEPDFGFSESLLRQIMQQPAPAARRSFRARFLARPVWAFSAALAVLILAVVALYPQQAVAAFETLLGYIPGIGFVQNADSTLYLEKPIQVEQAGVTLIVDQAVADAEKTVIAYRIEGLPAGKPGEITTCSYDVNRLQPLGGVSRPPIGGGVSNNVARIEFFPLPAGVHQAMLHVALSEFAVDCPWPPEWNVDIPFGSKPPTTELIPVMASPQVQTPTRIEPAPLSVSPSVETGMDGNPPAENAAAIEFMIDRVVTLADGTLVVGHAIWENDDWENVQARFESIQVADARGRSVPITYSEEGSKDNLFAFKIAAGPWESPLEINIQAVHVLGIPKESPVFSFDAGPQPTIGQEWKLNEPLHVLGQEVVIHGVRAVNDTSNGGSADGPNGYAVEFEAGEGVDNLELELVTDHPPSQTWSQGRKLENNHQLLENFYSGGLPVGVVTYKVGMIFYRLDGPWTLEWQLPSSIDDNL